MKKLVVVLIVAALLLGGFAFWKYGPTHSAQAAGTPSPKKPLPLVMTEMVKTQTISRTLELTGSVEPVRVARLASPAEGPVQNLKAREGDRVTVGEVLLTIGRKEAADAWLVSAREEVRKEAEELKRVEQLVEKGALPGDQLDRAKSTHERARAQLIKAEESSGDYQVAAPWDGIVCCVMVTDGNYVAPRAPLVEIFDPASLVIRLAVPEAEAATINQNMVVSVTLDAFRGKEYQGKISRVYPELDRRMRTRTIEVELMEQVALVPGMFARARLPLQTFQDAVVVPAEAVIVTPKGGRVAYVIEEGKAVQRKVNTGIEEGGKVQIVSGLKPGEILVVAGNEKLKDGVAVRVPEKATRTDGKPAGDPAGGVK
jgi:membrane fusion protein (multidrug efflux system)